MKKDVELPKEESVSSNDLLAVPTREEWYSLADWGDYTIFNGRQDNISHDNHSDKGQAEGVCRMLERDGFGGMREVFPVKTWVSQSFPANALPRFVS